jgi:hypothetical protein
MKLIVFGNRPLEISNMSYCVEYAFDMHRQQLVYIMEKIGAISQQLANTDSVYNNLFAPVHDRFVNFASQLPNYWQHNELVLRDLAQPTHLPLIYGILPPSSSITSSQACKNDRMHAPDQCKVCS